MERKRAYHQTRKKRPEQRARLVIPINKLSDDVLLQIFDLYLNEGQRMKTWQLLVHVCRRWRNIVFASPRHLKLQLHCTHNTPARDMLDIWPPLPLLVYDHGAFDSTWDPDNIVAALQHSDRVCQIDLRVTSRQSGKVLSAMRMPFPELTSLHLELKASEHTVIPDSFLGGSAPRLRTFGLYGVPFPGLPKLLLYTTHLVNLSLFGIPHSSYISPEVMVTALSTLTSLEVFKLGFRSPRSYPDQESRRPPHPTSLVTGPLKGVNLDRGPGRSEFKLGGQR